MQLLQETIAGISETSNLAGQEAQLYLDQLTKPPGSLGVLENIVVQLAAIQNNPRPQIGPKVVMVMAADHGVVEEGVSAFPQEVTPQMVHNFLQQGAAINVLARYAGARVVVSDLGIASQIIQHPDLKSRRIRPGTRNIAREAAMTEEEAVAALEAGISLLNEEVDAGAALVATGEMGIGNTTPSSAILACYCRADLMSITGRGTGLDDTSLIKKQKVIARALEVNKPDPADPLDVLRKVGGLEIAALTGVILGASARRIPVVIDGFISSAAALLAYNFNPLTRQYMIASHLSMEPGHKIMLEMMNLKPMLHLDLRLGEGTGAVLAFTLIEAALKIMNEMATFEQAGVHPGK